MSRGRVKSSKMSPKGYWLGHLKCHPNMLSFSLVKLKTKEVEGDGDESKKPIPQGSPRKIL